MNAPVTVASVDDYIRTFPGDVQAVLESIRRTMRTAAPEAVETISYGMPTVSLDGHRLVYFAGWKRHVALYAIGVMDPELEAELQPFRAEKDTVRFALDGPVPYPLIERLARALVATHPA